ncbi:MAG: RNA polymerase sigma factor [Deltaproteobacteria bacterium]|nr:RNA polymerase sigma factor [Deltaproteobacteria bacterium]
MTNYFAVKNSEPTAGNNQGDVLVTAAAGKGDIKAQRVLAERLFDHVRRTMSYLQFGDEAQDLAQTALIEVLRSASTFRGECTLEYWADRIVIRVFARHRQKFLRRQSLWDQEMTYANEPSLMTDELEALQMRRRISGILGELSRKHRTAIVLHYINGYSIEEVAQLVSAPMNTVRGRIRVGRKKLAALMSEDSLLGDWMSRRTP